MCQANILWQANGLLGKIKEMLPTSGVNSLPYWILNECTTEVDDIVAELAELVNFTMDKETVPALWKHAYVIISA